LILQPDGYRSEAVRSYPRFSSGSARISAQNTLNFDFGA
jgi:hypothetical protein